MCDEDEDKGDNDSAVNDKASKLDAEGENEADKGARESRKGSFISQQEVVEWPEDAICIKLVSENPILKFENSPCSPRGSMFEVIRQLSPYTRLLTSNINII
jgi:hypothetical protein